MRERSEGLPVFDPSVAVDAALTKLEEFTAQNAQEPFPHVYHLKTAEPLLGRGRAYQIKKQVRMLSSCIASIFSEEIRKRHNQIREEVQDDLLNAIGILKNHYPYIYKLEQGSPSHQALAKRFFSTIKNFNALIDLNPDDVSQKSSGFWRTIRSYLCRIGGLSITKRFICNQILLPNRQSLEEDSSIKLLNKRFQIQSQTTTTDKVSNLFQSTKTLDHHQDTELFWMKALSLLRNKGVYFDSIEEELKCIKQSPIYGTLTPNQSDGAYCESWTLEMKQVIKPFPGEKYIVVGQFMKHSHAAARGVPIPNSFFITATPSQTGFPHPCQYSGWALSEMLIPKCPHRLDLLPTVSSILKHQHETANQLIASEENLTKAKKIYLLRKKVFQEHLDFFLNLHETLCLTILNAQEISEDMEATIKRYFTTLRGHPDPFDCLAETHYTIMNQFVTKPYIALQNAWTEKGTLAFNAGGKAAAHILEKEIALKCQELRLQKEKTDIDIEKTILDFILVLGPLLATPSIKIILQEFSEIMNFEPPLLDNFAQKVQAAVYRQTLAFQYDLQADTEESKMFGQLKESLLEDIQLFSQPESGAYFVIVEELKRYFETRYASQKS
ncbi:hypothetical protein [Parachlamydia sp.]|uniref:hypothetical protein n=1 Tax=Parachlamydia sp. TaxID=2052048 RepID=UPI003D138373